MGSKKSLVKFVIIIVVLVGGAILWKGGFLGRIVGTTPGITPATQPEVEGQTGEQTTGEQTTGGSIGKMTDDIYLEIVAQSGYYAQKHPTDSMGAISYIKDLYKKYGITAENFSAYGEELEKNPQRYGEIGVKLAQRLQELQATGE